MSQIIITKNIQNPQQQTDIEKLFLDCAKSFDFAQSKNALQVELFEEDKNDFVYKILNLGMKLIKQGVNPNFCDLKINLEVQKFTRDYQLSDELLEKILLVKELITILSTHNINYLLELSTYYCCSEIHNEIYSILKDYQKTN